MKSKNALSLEGLANLANNSPESTYHGFTLAELEKEAAEDWPDIRDDPEQLKAFGHALATTRSRQRGERPEHYTKAAECAHCGAVWLWDSAPSKVEACPWCLTQHCDARISAFTE